VSSSCQSGTAEGSLQGSCAYTTSASSACTGPITVTMTGTSSNVGISYWEIHKTSGSWTEDTLGCTLNAADNSFPLGEALTLNNTTSPHVVFQDIVASGGLGGVTYYPWTMNGGSPSLYVGELQALTNSFASDVALLNTTSAPQPVWIFPGNSPGNSTGVCADAYY